MKNIKTKNKQEISIFVTGKNKPSIKDQIKFKAIEEGFFIQRFNIRAGNILHLMSMLKE